MKFTKKDVLTIPNYITGFRIVLLPFIVYAYAKLHNYTLTLVLVIISGISDILDGYIARKFKMISNFGKIIDPLADKLTMFTLIICTMSKYKMFKWLISLFVIKEMIVTYLGYLVMIRCNVVTGSRWYGKLSTFTIYIIIGLLVLLPSIFSKYANTMIIFAMGTLLLSMVMYSNMFLKYLLNKNRQQNN